VCTYVRMYIRVVNLVVEVVDLELRRAPAQKIPRKAEAPEAEKT